jgi:hypothetical protein
MPNQAFAQLRKLVSLLLTLSITGCCRDQGFEAEVEFRRLSLGMWRFGCRPRY